MTCIYLIYVICVFPQTKTKLKQLNFDFTKCKIPIPRYISHIPLHLLVVFESPVRSSYWVPMGANRDRDRLASPRKPKITELD